MAFPSGEGKKEEEIDVVVVGGGLSGLTCAEGILSSLPEGSRVAVIEARASVGGRTRTTRVAGTHLFDSGGTWIWPHSNPSTMRLAAAHAVRLVADPPSGRGAPRLDSPRLDSPRLDSPQNDSSQLDSPAGGCAADGRDWGDSARAQQVRVVGGLGALVDAVRESVEGAGGAVHLNVAVDAVRWAGDGGPGCGGKGGDGDGGDGEEGSVAGAAAGGAAAVVVTGTRPDGSRVNFRARACVVALPPRLASELEFDPPLPERSVAAMRRARTWMAQQGKWFGALRGRGAFEALRGSILGQRPVSGSTRRGANDKHKPPIDAFFWHTTDPFAGAEGDYAAVFGFLAHDADLRSLPRSAFDDMCRDQAARILSAATGEAVLPRREEGNGTGVLHIAESEVVDWASEPLTCHPLDAAVNDPWDHPPPMDIDAEDLPGPGFRGSLVFAGSETDSRFGGFIEGAVRAGQRAARDVVDFLRQKKEEKMK